MAVRISVVEFAGPSLLETMSLNVWAVAEAEVLKSCHNFSRSWQPWPSGACLLTWAFRPFIISFTGGPTSEPEPALMGKTPSSPVPEVRPSWLRAVPWQVSTSYSEVRSLETKLIFYFCNILNCLLRISNSASAAPLDETPAVTYRFWHSDNPNTDVSSAVLHDKKARIIHY